MSGTVIIGHFPVTQGFGERPKGLHRSWQEPTRSPDETARLTRIVVALTQARHGLDMHIKALEQLASDLTDAEMQKYGMHQAHTALTANHELMRILLQMYGTELALPPDNAS